MWGENPTGAVLLQPTEAHVAAVTRSSGHAAYPLLPQQFELLIEAISSLARTHGGVGLRSAIRCVEEILINNHRGGSPLIAEEFGTLITAADIYTVLEKDIVSVAREITLHVDAVCSSYGVNSLEHQVAMAIAVHQQIDGLPARNSASCPKDWISSESSKSRFNAFSTVIRISTSSISFTRSDGSCRSQRA